MRIFEEFDELSAFCTDAKDGNFADYTGDDATLLRGRREALAQKSGAKIALLKQIHGDEILEIKSSNISAILGGFWFGGEGDGMVSNEKGVVLAIQSADCAGVTLYDTKNRAVAALHAGRKGAALNILSKCVGKMQKLYGSRPENIKMYIGTHIRGCCYELPREMAAEFTGYENAVTIRSSKSYLDIGSVILAQAKELGIVHENIEISPFCSSCESDRFFSHRAHNGKCGRMLTAIGLKAI